MPFHIPKFGRDKEIHMLCREDFKLVGFKEVCEKS